ncbi:MAG: PEP-CTERM sorting domain-containing protein [Pseudomonadota bacterium]
MKTLKTSAALAIAAGAMMAATPASAGIFEYEMTNGDVLTINTLTNSGTMKGANIDASFKGDFSSFAGGAKPSFMTTLTELTGTRNARGRTGLTPTQCNGSRCHPYMLKGAGNGKFNLWSWWGNPVGAGDYVTKADNYRVVDVPAPGMLGLFGFALVALGLGRRRRKAIAAG